MRLFNTNCVFLLCGCTNLTASCELFNLGCLTENVLFKTSRNITRPGDIYKNYIHYRGKGVIFGKKNIDGHNKTLPFDFPVVAKWQHNALYCSKHRNQTYTGAEAETCHWQWLPMPRLLASSGHGNAVIMGATASQITSFTIVYSTVYPGADQRKHQSSASLAFVRGTHRWPVNSPHKWPVTRKMFPFDGVIMRPSV